MAALDFPDTPAVGETFGSSGTIWRWDGARWASTAGASGARGVVAMGSFLAASGSLVANVAKVVTNPLSLATVAGRTYRVSFTIRAFNSAAATDGFVRVALRVGGVAVSGNDPLLMAPGGGNYDGINYHWLLTGDGTTKVLDVALTHVQAATYYCETGIAAFYVEDITYEAGTGGPIAPDLGTVFYSPFPMVSLVAGSQNAVTFTNPGSVTLVSGASYVCTLSLCPMQAAVTQCQATASTFFGQWWQKVGGWANVTITFPVIGNGSTYSLTTLNIGDPTVAVPVGGTTVGFFRVDRVK